MTSERFDSHFQNISQIYKPFSPDCYIFSARSIDTNIYYIYDHMAKAILPYLVIIWHYGHIWHFDHTALTMADMGVYRTSTKNVAIWWKRFVNLTYILEMGVKTLWCHIFPCIFSKFLCIYIFDRRFLYTALKLK